MMKKLFGLIFPIVLVMLSGCGGGSPAIIRELAADVNTLALWHFNESSGQTAADSSGNGRDLVLGSNDTVEPSDPAWLSSGREGFGNCLSFTASESDRVYRSSGNSFPADTFTVEGWIKTSTGDAAFFCNGGSTAEVLLVPGGNIWFIIYDSGISDWRSCVSTGSVTDGQWHYVACTYDHAAMKIYIDGALDTQFDVVIGVSDPPDYFVGGKTKFLDGCLDEMRISDVARTAQEIADYHQQATQ